MHDEVFFLTKGLRVSENAMKRVFLASFDESFIKSYKIVVPHGKFPTGNSSGNLGFEFPISHGKKITISLGKNRDF